MNGATTETIQSNISKAKTFNGARLGKILPLPSHRGDKVLIRHSNSKGYPFTLSIVHPITAQERTIDIRACPLLGISTPELLYQFDVPVYGDELYTPDGYFYLYHSKGLTLAEELDAVTHYFFPHVYFNGHLCLHHRGQSPRSLYNNFWTSPFTNNWLTTYGAYYNWHPGYEPEAKLITPNSPETYQKHQTSISPKLDRSHRAFLKGYENFFELNEKPFGVFISTSQELVSATAPENQVQAASNNYYSNPTTYVLGFAFYRNQDYWIWLKNNDFLLLKPEQVKIL